MEGSGGDEVSSASAIAALVDRVERARAGELSLYGLLTLVEALGPLASELDRARRRREQGGAAVRLSTAEEALLSSEELLSGAPAEVKRQLAEEMRRALRPGGAGVTQRERTLALDFIEKQLKAAAKDVSSTGEARRRALRDTRDELETCEANARERDEVRAIERQIASLRGEFEGVSQVYEAWQAGKTKFKSNDQLQSTKRRYEALKRQVADLRVQLEAALHRRRPAMTASTSAGTAWAAAAPNAKAKAAGKARPAPSTTRAAAVEFAPPPRAAEVAVAEAADEGDGGGDGGGGGATSSGAGGQWRRRAKAAPARLAGGAPTAGEGQWPNADEEEAEPPEAVARPARMAAKPKGGAARKAALEEAKRRGLSVLQELSADLSAARGGGYGDDVEAAPARGSAAARAAPAAGAGAWRASGGWGFAGAEVQAAFADNDDDDGDDGGGGTAEQGSPSVEEPEGADDGGVSALPSGWEAVWSEENNAYFYWHHESGKTQWEPPDPPAARAPAAPPPRAAVSAGAQARGDERSAAKKQSSAGGGGFKVVGSSGAGGSAAESEDEPKLSYLCVCQAVAVELGKSLEEVEDLGVPSVKDWRANFSAAEWAQIRDRAIALEATQRAKAQQAEKNRAARHLAKVSKAAGEVQQLKSIPGGAKAKPAPAPKASSGGGRAKAAGKSSAGKKSGGEAALSSLATANRFANFGGSDSDD